MSVPQLTALWWWIDRWRKSTAYTDLTLEEQGGYRNLLDEANLRGGPLPNDERILAKACGDATRWPVIKANVMKRFTLMPDGWRNETLDAVLRESHRRANKQRDWRDRNGAGNTNGNGKSGLPYNNGNASGNGVGNANGNGHGNSDGSPTPTPTPTLITDSDSGSHNKLVPSTKPLPSVSTIPRIRTRASAAKH